jgi:hypothetical protein
MKRLAAGLAAGAVWLLAAMPALPQEPVKTVDDLSEEQMDELYCVYDQLGFFGDPAALTDAYMSGDPDSDAYKTQMEEVDSVAANCNDEYSWTEDRKDTVAMIGLYGVMGDELEARLKEAGLKEADVTAIYDTVDAMPDNDIEAFVNGDWIAKEDLSKRFAEALGKKGIKDAANVESAFYLAEAYVIVSVLSHEWMAMLPAS